MTKEEFEAKYQSEIPIYEAWGNFVNKCVLDSLAQKIGGAKNVETFLKIPPKPRIKDIKSIVSKAFFRDKNYTDPYIQITDKVGIRYVVLLTGEIKLVSDIVEKCADWTQSKDRDFEEERRKAPLIFDYQSVHYIVKSPSAVTLGGVNIPPGTPCEIQIRTLLQHACSELTHDTIYKPKTRINNPQIHRSVAKSRALSEAADDIFMEVSLTLQNESQPMNSLFSSLKDCYRLIAESDYDEKANIFILDALADLWASMKPSDIEKFLAENPSIKDIITMKSKTSFLHKQPVVLLLYYLIQTQRTSLRKLWPLTDSEIRPLFTDMAIAFDPN